MRRQLIVVCIILLLTLPSVFAVWNIFSPETPPPLIIRWIFEAPWFVTQGVNISFNESHFNQSVAGLINDTHIEGSPPWLSDDFATMYFNETKLNQTIDARSWSFSLPWFFNISRIIYFNSTLLNQTITALDTQKSAGGGYLYNDSTAIYLNGTALNETINALDDYEPDTDTHVKGDDVWLYNTSTTMYFNETRLNQSVSNSSLWYVNQHDELSPRLNRDVNMSDGNITDVDTIFVHNISGRSPVGIVNRSGHYMALFTDTNYPDYGSGFGDIRVRTITVDRILITGLLNYSYNEPPNFWDSDEVWIYEDNFTFYFNGTLLNQTIVGQLSNFSKGTVGPFLYNDTYLIYFNATLLNETIEALDNDTLGELNCSAQQVISYNGTEWICINRLAFTDTQKDGQGYLYNDSTTIFLNGTLLNQTIDARDTFYPDTDTQKAGAGYLFNDSIYIYLNGTLLNQTIDARDTFYLDTQKNSQGPYLYNDSTTIYLNGTRLNQTIEALDTYYPDTRWAIVVKWLYNNSGSLDFNETLLNNTIDSRDTDTHAAGYGAYLYNDSTYIYFNETKLNQTIEALDTDTQKQGGGYLYNDSTTIYLNGTLLNQTISALDRFWMLLFPWLYNSSGSIAFNETKLNETIDARDDNTQKNASLPYLYNDSYTIYINGTLLNQTIYALAGNTEKAGGGVYLYNDSDYIYLNGTLLNQTIEALDTYYPDTDTHVQGDGIYLYNDSTTMYFNETKLNNSLYWVMINGTLYPKYYGNISINGTVFADSFEGYLNWSWILNPPSGFTDSQKTTQGPYLYNDSTTIYLNGTLLNQTIEALDNDTQKEGKGYLYNDSVYMYLNGTLLNQTINALENDTHVKGDSVYLYNDSTTMYLNETKLNETIIYITDIKSYELTFNVTVAGGTGTYSTVQSINYLITQITVTPPSTPAIYRFEAVEGSDGDYIDRDRIPHLNVWDIYKTHSINDTVNTTISSATVDGQYSVRLKYIDNIIQV